MVKVNCCTLHTAGPSRPHCLAHRERSDIILANTLWRVKQKKLKIEDVLNFSVHPMGLGGDIQPFRGKSWQVQGTDGTINGREECNQGKPQSILPHSLRAKLNLVQPWGRVALVFAFLCVNECTVNGLWSSGDTRLNY
jgi:hypothetical protein